MSIARALMAVIVMSYKDISTAVLERKTDIINKQLQRTMAESSPTQSVDCSKSKGQEFLFDIVCVTCNRDGKLQEADGYCLDCCEHLCTVCLKYHSISLPTQHHMLVDKQNMPAKQDIASVGDICTERCHVHTTKLIEYFCRNHNILGCSVCVTLNHTLCTDVTYIPEAAAYVGDSDDLKDFQTKLGNLIQTSELIAMTARSNIKLSADYRAKVLQEIKIYRQEVNDALDKLKEDLENQLDEIEKKDTENMSIMAETSNQAQAELQRMSSDIKEILDKKQHCKLFIDMKNAEDKLAAIHDRLQKANDIFVTVVRFHPNCEFQNIMKRDDAFGKLLVNSPSKIKATFLTDINVSSFLKRCVYGSSALLSEVKLVIIDKYRNSVKLIDTEHKKILSEYRMSFTPYDVTILDNTKVAVTLPEAKEIQFLKSDDELRFDHKITLDAKCYCVASVSDKLVVSLREPCEVRILNMAGEVIRTFATSSQGDRLFSKELRLSVSPFNQIIYVTDLEMNRVTMLDMDGNVRNAYEGEYPNRPYHTAVDDTGMVYLYCHSRWSSLIFLLTQNCRKVKILVSYRDGIRNPQCICYCKTTRRLYVTMNDNATIRVYQLS